MYRKYNNGKLSIKDFNVPFGGRFDPDKRWVPISSLMPQEAGSILTSVQHQGRLNLSQIGWFRLSRDCSNPIADNATTADLIAFLQDLP